MSSRVRRLGLALARANRDGYRIILREGRGSTESELERDGKRERFIPLYLDSDSPLRPFAPVSDPRCPRNRLFPTPMAPSPEPHRAPRQASALALRERP